MPELIGEELNHAMSGLSKATAMAFSGGEHAEAHLAMGYGAAGLSIQSTTVDLQNNGPQGPAFA